MKENRDRGQPVAAARVRSSGGDASSEEVGPGEHERDSLAGLFRRLEARNWVTRDEAARALGRLRDPRAATSLAVALNDPVAEVRWSAAAALRALGDPRARDFYLDRLRSGSATDRWGAVWALGKIVDDGDPTTVTALRRALRDPSREVRAAAELLIGKDPF